MPLFTWLQNRMFGAFPQVWRNFMKDTTISFNEYVDGTASDIQTAVAKVWIPSYNEMQGNNAEPWVYEGKWVTFFTNNTTRIKWCGPDKLPRDGYQIFTSSTDPTLTSSNNVEDGDVWINTSESSRGYLRYNNAWVAATHFWLRGASVTSSAAFCYVRYSGTVNYGGYYATDSRGVCPRFSI